MLVLPLLSLVVAVSSSRAAAFEDLHRLLDKKDATNNNEPTVYPTITPSAIPTLSPMLSHHPQKITSSEHSKPLIEICSKKNAEKLDVCIDWIKSESPSVEPSTSPTLDISTHSPTYNMAVLTDVVNSKFNDDSERILIELGYFDMSITIITETKNLRSYDPSVHYSQGGNATRQYEHAAVKQHLHKVYTKTFLCPLKSLNLTFIDVGETNVSQLSTRSSIFYGAVEFEMVEGYPNPTKSDVDDVTGLAFSDDEKSRFLEEFRKYHWVGSAKVLAYDVIVEKLDQSSNEGYSADGIKNNENTIAILPTVGLVAGAITIICFAAIAFSIHRKSKREQSKGTLSKASPMHRILQKKHVYGEFESDGEEVIDFRANNINDAYMDSASIRSRSSDDSALQQKLEFHEESVDSLRELGFDANSDCLSELDELADVSSEIQ